MCLGLEGIVATLPTAVSPVDGRTFAVKDNICTDTLPTTCASKFLSGILDKIVEISYSELYFLQNIIHPTQLLLYSV